jgi:RHH-type proline utilization regulon transcriptional repressor/proline dehydrogenase/delta 1-pyrroline-5-carboxylate dehydrogenase
MRFETLAEAVAQVNQTGFGLTSGLESLDERDWDYWKENIRAGNLYINRVTTGAIVLRQPFGGVGKSVFGAGMKAGGPNYVAQLMDFTDAQTAITPGRPVNSELADLCERLRADQLPEAERITAAVVSYEAAQRDEFGREHDHFLLVGQDNVRRYRPQPKIRVRLHPDDTAFENFARVCAAYIAAGGVTVSVPASWTSPLVEWLEQQTASWAGVVAFVYETEEDLAAAIRDGQTSRVRYAAPDRVPVTVLNAAAEAGGCVISTPVSREGRLELLWYVSEQSISTDYHRYGNLGRRALEKRADIL